MMTEGDLVGGRWGRRAVAGRSQLSSDLNGQGKGASTTTCDSNYVEKLVDWIRHLSARENEALRKDVEGVRG